VSSVSPRNESEAIAKNKNKQKNLETSLKGFLRRHLHSSASKSRLRSRRGREIHKHGTRRRPFPVQLSDNRERIAKTEKEARQDGAGQ
jgi:hypothetical protein